MQRQKIEQNMVCLYCDMVTGRMYVKRRENDGRNELY